MSSTPNEEPPPQNPTAEAKSALSAVTLADEEDSLASNYGEITEEELESKDISGRNWMQLSDRYDNMKGVAVWISGYAEAITADGEETAFIVVRDCCLTVQCVVREARDLVSPQMVKFAKSIRRESMVHVEGVVSDPEKAFIPEASEDVEIQVRKLYCLKGSIPIPTLHEPINTEEDAARKRSDDIKLAKALWRLTLTLGEQVLIAKHNRVPDQSPRDERELVHEYFEACGLLETADALLKGDKLVDVGVESARRALISVIFTLPP